LKAPPTTIAIVANTSWNLVHFRSSLAGQFQEKGWRVLAIAPPGAYSDRLKTHPFSRYYPWYRLRPHSRNLLQEWLAARELQRLYSIVKPDLALHFTVKPNLYGSWAAARLGIPSISAVTGLGYPFLHPEGGNRFVPYLYRSAFRSSSAVVFQNEDDRALFFDRKLVDPRKAHLIPGSGVDTQFFQAPPGGPSPDFFTFLYAGRLLKDKGILEFLEAGRRLAGLYPRARFWIAGEMEPGNPAALSPEQLAPYLSLPAFRYWGFREDVRQLMAEADIFALPSHREGMPRAVLEAMSMAKPIIATDAPGCKETVAPGENGWLVAARDAEALIGAMEQAMRQSPAALAAMGEKSRIKAISQFDIQSINRQFLELAEQVLTHDIPARPRSIVF
jgi:glycosyltransferase involved in cell wall biosynthesis